MNALTVSNSGTAWIRDRQAQGKSADGGWASSPHAASYAALDSAGSGPTSPQSSLPKSLEELMKLQRAAADDNQEELLNQLQLQIAEHAAANGIASTGNLINVKA